ncbi:unnamed protein product [Brassica oleracea var. botrytis]|uniref:(rape) hypothetical protein n=1 Tax=Brassica napus TaxID=3708 RepID=A0A816JAF1_BRANA|nr:unnamed protein product [Brassica napus]
MNNLATRITTITMVTKKRDTNPTPERQTTAGYTKAAPQQIQGEHTSSELYAPSRAQVRP